MVKIVTNLDCLTSQIGLRGICDDVNDYELYLDDLPGINIIRFTKVTDEVTYKPAQLFESISKLSSKQVRNDFIKQLSKSKFKHKGVIDDDSIKLSGNHTFYGEVDEFLRIRIQAHCDDKFLERLVDGFRLVSDRDVVGKKFYIQTSNGDSKEIIQDLKKGLNTIPFSIKTDAEYIDITFDVSNFKVGRREYYNSVLSDVHCFKECDHYIESCSTVECYIGDVNCDFTSTNQVFGFDLCVRCQCSTNAIACYFADELQMALLYKMGINFLTEVKVSERINQYTNNSKDRINELLLLWNGGLEWSTGIKTHSEYWRSLSAVVESAAVTIPSLNSMCFSRSDSRVVNQLPG